MIMLVYGIEGTINLDRDQPFRGGIITTNYAKLIDYLNKSKENVNWIGFAANQIM